MLRLAQHEHGLPQEAHISWRSTTVLAMHAFEWYHDLLVTARLLQFDLNTVIQPKGVFLLDVAWNKLLLPLKRPLLLFLLWLQLSALEQKWTTIMMILSWYPYVSMVSCLTWFILFCFPDCKAWNKMSPSVRLFGIGLAEHFVSKSHCCQETQLWLVAQFCILQSREVGQLVRGFLCVLVLPYNDLKACSHHGYNIGSQLPSQKTCNILVPQNETQQRSRSKAPWLKAPWLGVSHATEAHLFVCRTLRILPGMLSVAGMTLRRLCREWCLHVSDFCLHPPQLFRQNVLAWPMDVHTVWVPNHPTPVASGPNPRFWSSLLFTWKGKVRRTTIGTNGKANASQDTALQGRLWPNALERADWTLAAQLQTSSHSHVCKICFYIICIMHCSRCTSCLDIFGPSHAMNDNLTCQGSLVCRNLCVAKALKPVHLLQPPEALTKIHGKFLEHHVLHGSYHIVWCCGQPDQLV